MMTSVATRAESSIVPKRVGRVLLVACWIAVLYGAAQASPHPSGPGLYGLWISAAVFLLTFTVAVELPGAARLIVISGLAGVAMQFFAPSNGAFVAIIAAISVAGIRLDPPLNRQVAAAIGVGFLLAGRSSAHPFSGPATVAVIPALLFSYLGANALRRLRAERGRTQQLLEEVVAGRDARVRAAALDERTRLAREIHDVLAHTLSALSIQLEGARMLAAQRPGDPEIATALERAGGLAKEGLGEARRAVGSLREEALPGPELLPQLAEQFEQDSSVSCRFEVEGAVVELQPEARLAVYRIAQEALTNVRKHADASGVSIVLRYTPDGVELVVQDEGAARTAPIPGGGYGISGMRERAELLHGRLDAGPTAAGFRVRLWIPRRANG
jgi:signal transduction histidine kinase